MESLVTLELTWSEKHEDRIKKNMPGARGFPGVSVRLGLSSEWRGISRIRG